MRSVHINDTILHMVDIVTCVCACVWACHSLDDHLQGLAQGHRLVVEEVEVQLVAEVGGGLQEPVELLLYHLVLLLGHLETDTQTVDNQSIV